MVCIPTFPAPPLAVHGPSVLANMLLNWFTAIGARTLEEQETHDPGSANPDPFHILYAIPLNRIA